MQQLFNQLIQFVQQGVAAIFRFVQLIWNWSVEQILRVLDAPWQNWPFWKQVLLALIAAGVLWALYKAAAELWEAGERTLAAFAGLLGALVRTLPHVLIAGVIAMGGIWVINNLDLSGVALPTSWQLGAR